MMPVSRATIPALLSLIAIGLCTTVSHATTYVGGGGIINDSSTNNFDILVDDITPISHFDSITFTGDHTFVGDLVFTLSHVNTFTSVTFINRVPSSAVVNGTYTFVTNLASQVSDPDSFWQAAFDAQETAFPIGSGNYAASSNSDPGGGTSAMNDLGDSYFPTSFDVFNGQNVNGIWRLTIEDQVGGDSGTLNSWSFAVNGAVVQEPSSLVLTVPAIGLIGGFVLRRRKK